MDNNCSPNIPEEVTEEQNIGNQENQNKPLNRFLRFLMSAGVVAALAVFIYVLFYFLNNGGA